MIEVSMVQRPDVARLAEMGFTLFPCSPNKQPRVPRGHDWRTPYDYEWRDDDLIGVAVPPQTVVLDIDNIDLFRSAGREVVMSMYSPTRRDGGLHIYYRTDGRDVPQVTEGDSFGYDTRVGGKGYVIAWNPQDWGTVLEWAKAPEWLYAEPPSPHTHHTNGDAPMGTRRDILSYLGHLALRVSLSEDDYYALLSGHFDNGRIVSLDPSRPWTDEDLRVLAREAAKWEVEKEAGPFLLAAQAAPEDLSGMNAQQLLDVHIDPLKWRIEGLMPEGLGLIAAPPKSGKSVFAYQVGVELAIGGTVLGRTVAQGPVLYYALEDGRRRSQTRIREMLNGQRRGVENLELRWTVPRLGGALEREVHEWLQTHQNALVIIDVLAMVRPAGGKASLNAYDVDYEALAGIHKVAKMHPGSTVLIVTHDRKAGSDDWMTRVTGTRGVTGAADFVIYIDRDRGRPVGKIVVSGRDVEDGIFHVAFAVTGWTVADTELIMTTVSDTRQSIYKWLTVNGPAWQKAIAEGTGLAQSVVDHRVADMVKDKQLIPVPTKGYGVPDEGDDADE